jgi:hypothetical protein
LVSEKIVFPELWPTRQLLVEQHQTEIISRSLATGLDRLNRENRALGRLRHARPLAGGLFDLAECRCGFDA